MADTMIKRSERAVGSQLLPTGEPSAVDPLAGILIKCYAMIEVRIYLDPLKFHFTLVFKLAVLIHFHNIQSFPVKLDQVRVFVLHIHSTIKTAEQIPMVISRSNFTQMMLRISLLPANNTSDIDHMICTWFQVTPCRALGAHSVSSRSLCFV